MIVYMHYMRHALLFQCIFTGEYKRLSSFLRESSFNMTRGGGMKILKLEA